MKNSPRTPESRRVRSINIGGNVAVATTVTEEHVLSYQFLDDVRVIGVQLGGEWGTLDAHANADGQFTSISEITRAGQRAFPGRLIFLMLQACWTAAIVLGSKYRDSHILFYPEGYGIDFDEGESIAVRSFLQYVGAGGDLTYYVDATIYYVER